MSRPRLLFVDDEPAVLGGLRRQLWERRADWDMAFAPSGAEALELLEAGVADVVVSDMRMPGMDGAALLEAVRKRWPVTVRVLLTGYADQEQALRAAQAAHQFLRKPCDPAELRRALERALGLGALVPDPDLRSDLARLVALPVLDGLQERIQAELDRPDASLRRLGALVEHDPGLSAKCLQLVNSAALALPQRVLRPAQAVALLGLEQLRSLWKAFQLRRSLRQAGERSGLRPLPSEEDASLEHGESVALAVRGALLPLFGDEAARQGFSAGLLHDIGVLALRHCRPEAWAASCGAADLGTERRACGADHAAAGAYLLGLWGLPESVVDAVARHHQGPDSGSSLQAALARAEAHQVALRRTAVEPFRAPSQPHPLALELRP